jgi:hypothetical protein
MILTRDEQLALIAAEPDPQRKGALASLLDYGPRGGGICALDAGSVKVTMHCIKLRIPTDVPGLKGEPRTNSAFEAAPLHSSTA